MAADGAARASPGSAPAAASVLLSLYVRHSSARSARAIVNVRALCERYLPGRYELEVIDIGLNPALALSEQLVAAPTLVRRQPLPVRRFIGDMSHTEHLLRGLDLPAALDCSV